MSPRCSGSLTCRHLRDFCYLSIWQQPLEMSPFGGNATSPVAAHLQGLWGQLPLCCSQTSGPSPAPGAPGDTAAGLSTGLTCSLLPAPIHSSPRGHSPFISLPDENPLADLYCSEPDPESSPCVAGAHLSSPASPHRSPQLHSPARGLSETPSTSLFSLQ